MKLTQFVAMFKKDKIQNVVDIKKHGHLLIQRIT